MNFVTLTHKIISRFAVVLMICCNAVLLTSCSTYSSKFNCSDSRGLPCTMLRAVDKQIDSGEIDKVYKDKCRGKKCKQEQFDEEFVRPKGDPITALESSTSEFEDEIILIRK